MIKYFKSFKKLKMKKGISIVLLLGMFCSVKSQDTLIIKADSMKIGNMIIVNQDGSKHRDSTWNDDDDDHSHSRHTERSNFSLKEWVFDLGFANFDDHTNYSTANANNYLIGRNAPFGQNNLKLRQGKSSNINIWFFMQRMNLIKHFVNLKYGLGLELNNYRFDSPVTFREGGTSPYNQSQNIPHAFVFIDSISFKKDKLSLDYITVPLMLNFQTNPNYSDKGLSFSGGVSMSYLYASRNKQVSVQRGKHHNKGDYDVNKFKFSYIAELGLGKIRLYGSYTPVSIFKNGLDIRPYTIGFRFSEW